MTEWQEKLRNPCCMLIRKMMLESWSSTKEEWEKLSCEQLKYFLMAESERGKIGADELLEAWRMCKESSSSKVPLDAWRDVYI